VSILELATVERDHIHSHGGIVSAVITLISATKGSMVTRCNQCDSTFLMLLYGQLAKGAATSQKLGVSVFSVPENAQLQRSKASRGSRGMWRGGYLFTRHQSHPSPADYRGSGECRKLRERSVTGTEPQPQKRFWGVSCAVLCDFTHHLGRFTAA